MRPIWCAVLFRLQLFTWDNMPRQRAKFCWYFLAALLDFTVLQNASAADPGSLWQIPESNSVHPPSTLHAATWNVTTRSSPSGGQTVEAGAPRVGLYTISKHLHHENHHYIKNM